MTLDQASRPAGSFPAHLARIGLLFVFTHLRTLTRAPSMVKPESVFPAGRRFFALNPRYWQWIITVRSRMIDSCV